ncbi:MAG: hypothetical protein KC503_25655 [Myxococcales bacterium]|nr:hypothetical protein [Myxococcales bacterium]
MQSYSRRRALSLAVLLAVSLLPVVASAQLGGIGGGFGGTINNTTDVNVANAAQSRHLPRAKHDSHTTLLPYHNKQTISLYAWTRKGLSVRTIDSDGRKWDDWRHLGNNADNPPLYRLDQDDPQNTPAGGGIDTGLVVRDALGASSDHQLFFGYSTSQLTAVSLVRRPLGGAATFTRFLPPTNSTLTPSLNLGAWRSFSAQAAIYTSDNRLEHIFGSGMIDGAPRSLAYNWVTSAPLVELERTQSGNTRVVSHGTPSGVARVRMGPGSATVVTHRLVTNPDGGACCDPVKSSCEGQTPCYGLARSYVFVTADSTYDAPTDLTTNGSTVYMRTRPENGSWSWSSLGAPTTRHTYGAPTVATYFSANPLSGGTGQLALFVTAFDERANRYKLYRNHHNGNGFQGWVDVGRPSDIPSDVPFELTTALVWYQGNKFDWSALRIELYGHSRAKSGAPAKLVHYRWSGSTWYWAPSVADPRGGSLRTESAAALDQSSYQRVSAFARADSGHVFEYVLTSSSASPSATFTLKDLSFEPKFKLITYP